MNQDQLYPPIERRRLSIRCIEHYVARQFPFPSIAVVQQSLLVVVELLARLGREFEVWSFDDRVHWTGFLTHAAIDALDHVDVVACCAAGAIVASRSRLDRDCLGRTNRLAQFAGDAPLFAVRIAALRMLAAKAGAKRRLLMRIVKRRPRLEHIADRQPERSKELTEKQRAHRLCKSESHWLFLSPQCKG